ncbi:MAG: hypothetical protein ACRDBQ_25175 [Shewanella sp.]
MIDMVFKCDFQSNKAEIFIKNSKETSFLVGEYYENAENKSKKPQLSRGLSNLLPYVFSLEPINKMGDDPTLANVYELKTN